MAKFWFIIGALMASLMMASSQELFNEDDGDVELELRGADDTEGEEVPTFVEILDMLVVADADGDGGNEEVALELRYTSRQMVALKKAFRFFKKADTNHSGLLSWYEYWNAV